MTTNIRGPNNLLDARGKLTKSAICTMYTGNTQKNRYKNDDDASQDVFHSICANYVGNIQSKSPFQCQSKYPVLGHKVAIACANTRLTQDWSTACNTQIDTNSDEGKGFPLIVDPSGMCGRITEQAGTFNGGYSYDYMPGFQQGDTAYCNDGNLGDGSFVKLTGLVGTDPHSKYVDCNYTLKDEDIKKMSSEDMAIYSKIYEDQDKFKVKDERTNGYYTTADEKTGSWQSGNRQLLSTWCWTRDKNNPNQSNQLLPRVLTKPTICKPLTRNNELFNKEVASWCNKCNQEIKRFKKQCDDQKIKCTIKGDQCPECDCFNDLNDPDILKALSEIATNFHNDEGGSGDSSCYWNSCADTAKTLQPDMKKKCPTKVPQCNQIIQIVNPKHKIRNKISENINCTGKKGPAPAPGPPIGSLKIAGGGLLVLVALAVLFFILHRKSTDPTSLFGFLGIQNKTDFLGGLTGILVCIAVLIFIKSQDYQ